MQDGRRTVFQIPSPARSLQTQGFFAMMRLIDSMLLNLMQPAVRGDKGLRDDMDAARQRHRAAKAAKAQTVNRLFD
jgi:hypothetical protein